MQFEKMILEKENGVATLTLNHPEKLNAMTTKMYMDLGRVIETIEKDNDIKVLVITGSGRAFCSGSDVSGRMAANIEGQYVEKKAHRELVRPIGYEAYLFHRLDIPIIAAINGVAAGAGLSFALLSDIRIASETARFTAAWVRRGLIGDLGATYFLPRIVGISKALEILMTGDVITAEEAERIGLVTKVVAPDRLMPTVYELAFRLAKGPTVAINLMKRSVYSALHNDLLTQLHFESFAQNVCRQTEDHREGVKAFIKRREAQFKGM